MNINKLIVITGVIGISAISIFTYISSKDEYIEVAIAKHDIEARSKISKDDIEYIEVPKSITNDIYISDTDIINKYTEIEGMIPKGSFFYKSMLFNLDDLNDKAVLKLNKDQSIYPLKINLIGSSGNSIVQGSRVDLYVKFGSRSETIKVEKAIENIRVLSIIDSKGRNIEDEDSSKIPYIINLAINEEYITMLKKVETIGDIELFVTNNKDSEESKLVLDNKYIEDINNAIK